ncbi:Cytochrome P450 [Coniochaeta hoffmannii]|uniref:Cytochrome P450 n=1 Tax=Coniochaeta hoffmannii TaxID=91930 RepID=A0AA38VB89_9PEZI|nr:Cytochrome P450 [Coniochaeta hoffmannii]
MSGLLIPSLLLLATLYALLHHLHLRPRHPREPPIIPSRLPYLGPLLGMALQGGRYLKGIGLANRHLPVFTLPVPFSRMYIVTSPPLAAAVQRASKTLSFTPLVPDITRRVLGLDEGTARVVRDGVEEEVGFLGDMREMVYGYLGPGARLEELSLAAGRELGAQVAGYVRADLGALAGAGREVPDLLVWIRHFVAQGTGRLLYGEENPLALSSGELEEAFWDFDHGLGGLLAGVWPRLTARKAYRGRERLVGAFEGWIEAGRDKGEDVPDIIRERMRIAKEHGFSTQAAARSEVSFLFAGIVNTATTTFWTILQVFARSDLLAGVREEIGRCVDEEGKGELRLSLEKLKTDCPILSAVVRECLRLGSDNYSVRLVKADTELAGGQYMLKAGGVVQIAGGVIHADRGVWGGDVDVFDHTRFLKTQQPNGAGQAEDERERPQVQQTLSGGVHPAAFRAFGGGRTLCPGRHFAITEILAFVAVIVLTFEIEAVEGSGRIRIPKKNDGVLPVHILEPVEPVRVRVRLREGEPRIVVA